MCFDYLPQRFLEYLMAFFAKEELREFWVKDVLNRFPLWVLGNVLVAAVAGKCDSFHRVKNAIT